MINNLFSIITGSGNEQQNDKIEEEKRPSNAFDESYQFRSFDENDSDKFLDFSQRQIVGENIDDKFMTCLHLDSAIKNAKKDEDKSPDEFENHHSNRKTPEYSDNSQSPI